MAVSIRLRREGARNRPYYRIVVADSRARRDGRFIEVIGTYDPLKDGVNHTIDLAKAEDWLRKGARPSDTVKSLIARSRVSGASAESAEASGGESSETVAASAE